MRKGEIHIMGVPSPEEGELAVFYEEIESFFFSKGVVIEKQCIIPSSVFKTKKSCREVFVSVVGFSVTIGSDVSYQIVCSVKKLAPEARVIIHSLPENTDVDFEIDLASC